MRGFWAVLRKEWLHMTRDRATMFFALGVPVFQLVLFGLIDTNVRHVPTAVLDHSRTAESRQLVQDFVNTSYFDIAFHVGSRQEMQRLIVAAKASVGIEIPPDYARRRLAGEPAHFLVLIDGSDSTISSATLAAANGVALSRSLGELLAGGAARELPLQPHPQLLFNPDSRSANLLIPGLVAILLTFSATILSAFAIVRERERGTLEQLMVTPVSPFGVVVGKLLPFLGLAYAQLAIVLTVMRFAFRVPIHGSLALLLALSLPYLLALLALGLLMSSRAKTQAEAMQMAMSVMLPSVMLSGYIFPLSSLPAPLRVLSAVLPATHFIAITRGVIVRSASWSDLWPHAAALFAIAALLVLGSTQAFKKTLS
jgi:ABC-2 type transport system permease protein